MDDNTVSPYLRKDGKIPYTGIECDRCKEMSWSYVKEICMACGSGMNLWSEDYDLRT